MIKVYEVGEVYFDRKTPVPTYDEYRLLKKEIDSLKEQIHSMLFTDDVVQERYDKAEMKIHILEHQLEIATKALRVNI